MRALLIIVIGLLGLCGSARAHELWIEAENYAAPPGSQIRAQLRNGQMFVGINLPYLPLQTALLERHGADGATPITARPGDRPAISVPSVPGLNVLSFVSRPSVVQYQALDEFLSFATHKGWPDAAADHRASGLTDSDIAELYTRYSKALVQRGPGGQDTPLGHLVELIALDPVGAQMRVELRYQGAPAPGRQVEQFIRQGEDVTLVLHRTGADGTVTIPVAPGAVQMLNAVILRTPDADLQMLYGAHWESLWANLTFAHQ